MEGKQQRERPQGDEALAQADHLGVAELHGEEAAKRPACGDAQEEQPRVARRRLRRDAPVEMQVAAAPQDGGLLQGAVAEKGDHDLPGPGDAENLGEGEGGGAALPAARAPADPPQGQADHKDGGEGDLEQGDAAVAHVPPGPGGQGQPHDIGPHGRPQPPHAVQPAHVAAGVVQGHVVVQRRVHAARPQAVGDCPQAQPPEGPAGGEAEQGGGGQPHAGGGDPPGAQPFGEPVALQAGHHRAHGDDDGDRPGPGGGHAQVGVHHRPGRAQQGIGQAQADEGEVDDGQKQVYHMQVPPFALDMIIPAGGENIYGQNRQIPLRISRICRAQRRPRQDGRFSAQKSWPPPLDKSG